MVPTIAANGSSFKGASLYYLHDKDAKTRERVEWTHTENLVTNDPDKAWKMMAWTASNQATLKENAGVSASGRKLQKPVLAFSVSWHPDDKPDKEHMLATAKAAAAALDLSEHQAIYICHNDEPQPHVHILVNRVHPMTGKAATLSKSRERLSAWALDYEKRHGKIRCKAREEAAEERAANKDKNKDANKNKGKAKRTCNPVIQAAWENSDCGRSFQAALEAEKFTLAWGNKRFVVVDRWGKAVNPVRHLVGVRASAFNDRLQDIDRRSLPLATIVQRQIKVQDRKEYHASRKYDRWAAGYLNQLQDRHLDERAKLQIHCERVRDEKKVQLADYYQTDKRAKDMAQLQKTIENSGLFRRLTGGVKRDRAELASMQQVYEDIQKRTKEELDAVQTEKVLVLSDQADRHDREKELAHEHIAEKKPSFYREEEITKDRSTAQERDQGEGREIELHNDL